MNEKWAIAGKSYGGYLAAYAIGHCEQLCAAVISAPVSDLEGHFGTSDSGYYSDPYAFLGDPFEEKEVRDNSSPIKEADRASIPTLILQGEADERCPKNQSEQLFVRLARKPDLPVEMVLYPNGSHHFFERGDPKHRVDAVARLVRWIKDWSTVSQGASVGGQDKEHPHSYDAVKEPAVATS
ncbi:MAG: peptidase [Bradyrhizobium sp.]|nr:peptidase [Bradyrhizobium sp.]